MRSAYPRIGLFIVLFASAAAAVDLGPTSKVSATAWIPPVTPYGTPDLGGVWVNNRATPLERPKALEGRPFLTDAEVIILQQRADRLFKNGNSDFAAGDAVFLAAFANLETYVTIPSWCCQSPVLVGRSRRLVTAIDAITIWRRNTQTPSMFP